MDDNGAYTQSILRSSRFWVQKVMVPTLLCLGLIGNTITVMVLTRRRMRSSTNIYLSALAVADIIHLIFGFLLSFEHYANIHDRKYELYWRFYGLTHWLCDAASATSAWLAVSFTVERYIAVCHPVKGKAICTERRAKSVIVIVYIFCILTTISTTFEYQLTFDDLCIKECPLKEFNDSNVKFDDVSNVTDLEPTNLNSSTNSISEPNDLNEYEKHIKRQLKKILANCTNHPHIIFMPIYPQVLNSTQEVQKYSKFVETQIGHLFKNENENIGGNETKQEEHRIIPKKTYCCEERLRIDVENTELGKSKTYQDFIYWYSALFFAIIPLILIATFNCFLIRTVYLSQKIRRVMTNSQDNVTSTQEKRITIMLIGIVFTVLICTIPTAVHLIYYHFNEPVNERERNIRLILGNFCNFMVMMNAPCNFLIYCLLSKKFRVTFKKMFWEYRRGKQIDIDTVLLSSSKGRNSKKFNVYKHGVMKKMASEYRTPRNLEAHSLTSIPRSKSMMARPIGKAKSCDLNI
ncbi:uncharacterized protein LOC130449461 isoform X3 [Diorhabda sublineata]|nr:uncharacterized protein LOC130449461 isoform X3 [Diorhabda sublineata]